MTFSKPQIDAMTPSRLKEAVAKSKNDVYNAALALVSAPPDNTFSAFHHLMDICEQDAALRAAVGTEGSDG